jgi:hypothetical protein
MLVTPLGIVTLARLLQFLKALAPMLITPSGMFMTSRLSQLSKASFSMLVTPLGIVTLARFLQFLKALAPMLLTPLGMIKEVSAFPAGYATKVFLSLLYKTPSSEAYSLLPESTYIALRLAQLEKASIPMLLTLSGIVMLSRLVQPLKALYPMLVTPLGIVTLARLVHS